MYTKETQHTITIGHHRLKSQYPVLHLQKPLSLGIHEELIPLIQLNSRKVIRLLCTNRTYIENVSRGGSRYGLGGSISRTIMHEQLKHFKNRLDALKNNEGNVNTERNQKSEVDTKTETKRPNSADRPKRDYAEYADDPQNQ